MRCMQQERTHKLEWKRLQPRVKNNVNKNGTEAVPLARTESLGGVALKYI